MGEKPSRPNAKWSMKQRVLGQLILGSIFGILFVLYRYFFEGEPYTIKTLLIMAFIGGPIGMLLGWVRWTWAPEIGRKRRAARKFEKEQMQRRESEGIDE